MMLGILTVTLHCLKSLIFFHFMPNTYFRYQHLQLRTQMLSIQILQDTASALDNALTYIH